MQLTNDCFEKTKKEYLNFISKEKIYNKSIGTHIKSFKNAYIPIAFWINNKCEKKGKTLLLGLSASQGSGKTTVAAILSIILKKFFKRNVCVISIDDFYIGKKAEPLPRAKDDTRNIDYALDEITLIKLLKSAKDFREGRITESEFDRVKDDILKTL